MDHGMSTNSQGLLVSLKIGFCQTSSWTRLEKFPAEFMTETGVAIFPVL